MAVDNCTDCDYVSDGVLPSDGKCADCHGSGYEADFIEALGRSIAGQSQKCEKCGGTGKCQTCYGKGYLVA